MKSKRVLALLLAVFMVLGMLPASAFAAGGETQQPETAVCAELEGCTEEVHAEGCPLYVKPETPEETPEEQPTQEQPTENTVESTEAPANTEEPTQAPADDEAAGDNAIAPAAEVGAEPAVQYGTVDVITQTAKVEEGTPVDGVRTTTITVAESALTWYAQENVRPMDGWWVGLKINAPEGMTEGQAQAVTYQRNDGTTGNFGTNKDGLWYIGVWGFVNPEYLKNANGHDITYSWAFDWDGNDTYEDVYKLVIKSTGITLYAPGSNEVVAETGGNKFGSLQDAIDAAGNGQTVTLLKDVELASVNDRIEIAKSITLDGGKAKHSIIGTTAAVNRVIMIKGKNLVLTLKNLKIRGVSGGSDMRCISLWGCTNIDFTLNNVEAFASFYCLNATDNVTGNITVTNSKLTGWAAMNIHASNSTFTVTNSELIGINDKGYNAGGWNRFSTIAVGSTAKDESTAAGTKVIISNSTIKAIIPAEDHNEQSIAIVCNPTATVELTGCKIVTEGSYKQTENEGGQSVELTPDNVRVGVYEGTLIVDGKNLKAGEDRLLFPLAKMEETIAEIAVAEVGGNYYASLQDAINEGGKVTLLKSTTESVTVSNNVTLNLNGKTLTNEAGQHTITVAKGGELYVCGNGGTVDNVSHKCAAIYNNGFANLFEGTYKRSSEKGVDSGNNGGNSFYTIVNHGTMIIDGAGLRVENIGKYSSMIENGYQNHGTEHDPAVNAPQPDLSISDGTFVGGLNNVKNDDNGVLTINGGEFSGAAQHAVMNWNVAKITGGSFTSTGTAIWNNDNNKNDTINQGKMEITNGIFSSDVTAYCVGNNGAYKNSEDKYVIGSLAGSVEVLTAGGQITTEQKTGNVTVTFGKGNTLGFTAEGTAERPADKWWAGIQVNAPTGVDAGNAQYTKIGEWWNDDGNAADWTAAVAVQTDGQYWGMATPAYMETYKGADNKLIYRYKFDWNGDDKWDQYVTIEIVEGVTFADAGIVAEVTDSQNNVMQYETLAAAVAAAQDGDTVSLLQNATGSGIIVNKNLTINFGGFTYTVGKNPLAGSGDKYATQGFQLLAGDNVDAPNTVTLKNGTIALPSDTPNLKMGIQNYSNLTLNNMKIDASGNTNIGYVVSNNNGSTKITNGTVIKAAEGQVAFDVYDYSSNGYGNVSVTVDNATIVGKIEVSDSEKATLAVKGGSFTQALPVEWCAGNLLPVQNEDGTYGVSNTLTLSQTSLSLTVGYNTSAPVPLTVTPDTTADITWSSSDTSVATVDQNGVVRAVGNGTATITAEVNGVPAACEVTVTRTYAPYIPPTTPDPEEEDLEDPDVPLLERPWFFIDVPQNEWYYAAAVYAWNNNMMNGITDTLFCPDEVFTRGMVVTILHRLEGEPQATPSNFPDVDRDQWYTAGVDWAAANGIVEGYPSGWFHPNDAISRQELAAILSRYATFKGIKKEGMGDINIYTDASLIAEWALDDMTWAVSVEIMTGKGDGLYPTSFATRAEAAKMLMTFCENLLTEDKDAQ